MNYKLNPIVVLLILVAVGFGFFSFFSSRDGAKKSKDFFDWWDDLGVVDEMSGVFTKSDEVYEFHNKFAEAVNMFVTEINNGETNQAKLLALKGHSRKMNRFNTDILPSDYKEKFF